ncbi:MAG: anti-sigma factor [Rhodobacterales bacterium]|nr:anti-sigma factor [Rhodobacterales bacterium]
MTGTDLHFDDDEDALAAEYVLGVLDLPDRLAVEARIKADPDFAQCVTDWENRLADLNDDFAESPAPNLLPRIEARLFPGSPARKVKEGRGRWSWLAGAVAASVLILAVVATLTPPRVGLVATLATADARLSYEVRSFGSTLQVTRVAGLPAVQGQVHELWLIAPDAAPVSLGLLQDQVLSVSYPVPPAGWTFAVSIEPEGGSPTGQPTGPVILTAVVAGEA